MSENVKLADLMKEKLEEEKASKEVTPVEEPAVVEEEPIQAVPDPVAPVAPKQPPAVPDFNAESLQSADLSTLVPSGTVDKTKEAQDEIAKELEAGIADAIERRFKPALREIHEMRQEYEDLKAMGEENPQVVSKYDPQLE